MHDGDTDVHTFTERVRDFISNSVSSGVACPEYGTILPPGLIDRATRWQAAIAQAGFAGIDWSAAHHGRGLSEAHSVVWYTECAQADVAPYANFQGYVLTAGALRAFGTPEQTDRHLPGIVNGSTVWCQLFSEPGSGSDLSSLMTKAEPDGDGWRITGQKIWTSTAQVSQWGILLARTDPSTKGARGISFLLIDMDQQGIDVRPIKQMTGDDEFCEVFLDGARVEGDGVLGGLHGGWRVATSVLADERAAVGAASVRLDRRLQRIAPDDPRGLVDHGFALRRLMDRSGSNPLLGPLSKLALTEFETHLSRAILESHGAEGMIDNDDTDAFLYAPGMRLAGGTSEVQRDLVGERLLGLPRAPRP
ncbi:MAG: acyl-CoA dehydrogenase family protein [Actinomycetota bacterium]|nr:acyl-CoA dehydrogenase family protein [Actinomycetota bacterium]